MGQTAAANLARTTCTYRSCETAPDCVFAGWSWSWSWPCNHYQGMLDMEVVVYATVGWYLFEHSLPIVHGAFRLAERESPNMWSMASGVAHAAVLHAIKVDILVYKPGQELCGVRLIECGAGMMKRNWSSIIGSGRRLWSRGRNGVSPPSWLWKLAGNYHQHPISDFNKTDILQKQSTLVRRNSLNSKKIHIFMHYNLEWYFKMGLNSLSSLLCLK